MNHVDVIVVGGGPTGVMAGIILGKYGLKTVVFDKLKDIFPQPRAAVFDDDIARIIQFGSLENEILEVSTASKGYQFLDQQRNPMFGFKRTPDRTLNGYPTSLCIRQPIVEKVLRSGLEKDENVSLLPSHEVVAIEETADSVTVTVNDMKAKEEKKYQAKYVIAADGARSTVRDIVGIEREDMNFDHPWFIVDIKAPNGINLQPINQQFCTPSRPATYLYLGNDLHRFEIALHEDETQSTYKTDESIKELLSNWIDTTGIEVDRKIIYVFHAYLAKERRRGRVFLTGDAAHQMPPFLGQGLSSGIRDAANISWKIAHVLKHNFDESILDTYEKERLPHVEKIMRQAVQLGEIIQTSSQEVADFRDRLFKYLNSIPNVHEALHNLERSKSPIGTGFHHATLDSKENTLFPQPIVQLENGKEQKLDDVIGTGFALVASANVSAELFEALKKKVADLGFSDFFACLKLTTEAPINANQVKEEASLLADWFADNRVDVAIVRPDHYVYAKTGASQAVAVLEDLEKVLHINVLN